MTSELDPVDARPRLEEACRLDGSVLIKYQSPTATTPTLFLLFPKHVVHQGGHWYVDGWATVYSPRRRRSLLLRGSGQQRRFRLDRMLEMEPVLPEDRSVRGAIVGRIEYQFATRGPIGGLVALFLDFLVVALFVALIVSLLKWLWRLVSG
jgi:hypothetical protein